MMCKALWTGAQGVEHFSPGKTITGGEDLLDLRLLPLFMYLPVCFLSGGSSCCLLMYRAPSWS